MHKYHKSPVCPGPSFSCSGLALAEAVGIAAAVVVLLHEDAAAGPEMGMDAKPLLILGREAFWKPLWLGPCPPPPVSAGWRH